MATGLPGNSLFLMKVILFYFISLFCFSVFVFKTLLSFPVKKKNKYSNSSFLFCASKFVMAEKEHPGNVLTKMPFDVLLSPSLNCLHTWIFNSVNSQEPSSFFVICFYVSVVMAKAIVKVFCEQTPSDSVLLKNAFFIYLSVYLFFLTYLQLAAVRILSMRDHNYLCVGSTTDVVDMRCKMLLLYWRWVCC